LECYVNTISALRRYELGDIVRIFRNFEVIGLEVTAAPRCC